MGALLTLADMGKSFAVMSYGDLAARCELSAASDAFHVVRHCTQALACQLLRVAPDVLPSLDHSV